MNYDLFGSVSLYLHLKKRALWKDLKLKLAVGWILKLQVDLLTASEVLPCVLDCRCEFCLDVEPQALHLQLSDLLYDLCLLHSVL